MKLLNRITLKTPESVELEFVLAGIGGRALALIIDYTIWWIILFGFAFFWLYFSERFLEFLENILTITQGLELWLFAIWMLVTFCVYIGYFILFEVLWQGQTPGKKIIKIRVIRDDGRSVRLPQATLRALLRPIDDFLFLGAFLIAFGKREQRLGDLLAGTVVVQEERPEKNIKFTLAEEAITLAKTIQKEAEIYRILPEDFAILREYLQRREKMTIEAKTELSRKLAHQIKDLIRLEIIPPQTTPNIFLEAIYLAYQQQSSNSY